LANVLAAVAASATLLTHCEVIGARPGRLLLLDRLTQLELEVTAPEVVNATGPRADALRHALRFDGEPLVRQSRGSHLVLPPRAGEQALAAFLPDRRIQFVVPHTDGTVCGTTEVEDALPGDETGPPREDLDYLLAALGWLLDPAPRAADVVFAYAGWRSLPARRGPAGALHREAFVVAEAGDGFRLHTVVGGKLTTHRSFAERSIAGIFGFADPSPTRRLALPGGDGPREVQDPLWWRHGSRAGALRLLGRDQPDWLQPLCPHRPFLGVELVHALRHEGAVTFADAMLRRLVHSQGPCVQTSCLRRAHEVFLATRLWPVDDDAAAAIAALRAELRRLQGELPDFVAAAAAAGSATATGAPAP
jgi:glycerol-3-phosphate dehydrogenase